MLKGLEHVGIKVSDMARSLEFYQGVLGLQLCERVKVGEDLELAFLSYSHQQDFQVELVCGSMPESLVGVVNHLAFCVENIDEELARLVKRGVELVDKEPRSGRRGMKIAFFKGPDGEKLEFVQK